MVADETMKRNGVLVVDIGGRRHRLRVVL